ncbi:MAG: HPF/RaiA family ribosome-associated protein [Bryobacterales bacterium]|nr:HPF/RaiA family ribosome-associated protein [Bryobacterales bacterium]
MKIHYTGKLEKQDAAGEKKLQARMDRLAKLLGRRNEKELHVILKTERHLHRAEITLNINGQPQAGLHAAPDQLSALTGACDKLEKQILKQHDKKLAVKRRAAKPAVATAAAVTGGRPDAVSVEVDADGVETKPTRIYRRTPQRKPMTLDEALLEISAKTPYVAYRDAGTSRVSVLIRRADGHLDLIEG